MDDAQKHIAVRDIARDMVKDSIITDAVAQFIALTIREIHSTRIEPLKAENMRLRTELEELDFLRHEGGPQSVAAIEASLRELLKLHEAHHNHPVHAAARRALAGDS